jgi:hypothetical protein
MNFDISKPLPPSDYLDAINDIIQKSVDEAEIAIDAGKIAHKTSGYAMSVLVSSLMIANAKERFFEDTNVSYEENGHGAVFLFRNINEENINFDIRFKKCDPRYLTWNSQTARNNKFENQLNLFYSEPERSIHYNLNAVYKHKESGADIETWITFPIGARSISWKFQLSNSRVNREVEREQTDLQDGKPESRRAIPIEEKTKTNKLKSNGID